MRILIGAMFVLSAAMKIDSLDQFRRSIIQFKILPRALVTSATILIPSIELVCGVVFVISVFRIYFAFRPAAYFLMAMLSGYTLAISVNLWRGNIVECNCFGSLDFLRKISLNKILFNLIILAALWSVSHFNHIRLNMKPGALNLLIIVFSTSLILNIPLYNHDLRYSLISESIRTIPIERALELVNNHKAILVDTRDETAYSTSHIPQAISMPIKILAAVNAKDIALENNKMVLIYCDSQVCGQAQLAAEILVAKGFSSIFIIKGGYRSWVEYNSLRK